MDDECPHGMGMPAACVLCNGRAKREAAEQAEQPRTFPARNESQCPECDLPIIVGQIVSWKPGERAMHEDCR